MFPILEASEIERIRRYGTLRSFAVGEYLTKMGEAGHGLTIILSGEVEIAQHDHAGVET